MPQKIKQAYSLAMGLLFMLFSPPCWGQDQRIADSLTLIYQKNTTKGSEKLELLRNLAFNEQNDTKLALKYAEELILLSKQAKDNLYLYRGYYLKGHKKRFKGDIEEALATYFKALITAQSIQYQQGVGASFGAIADMYSIVNNQNIAKKYYNKAIQSLKSEEESIELATAYVNAGDEFYTTNSYDTALIYFKESARIFEKLDYPSGKAYSLGNIGMVYAKTGKHQLAERNINEAVKILELAEDHQPICDYLLSMVEIYQAKKDQARALEYAARSLKLAEAYGLKEQISNASLSLSELYENQGNSQASLRYYKNHVAYRDSLNNLKSVQAMADLRTDFEVSEKQAEVDLLNEQKRNQRNRMIGLSIILGLISLLLGALYWFYRAISREHKVSESLLLNILPAETAQELKSKGKVDAVKIDQVTVLFTDFVEFSKRAEHIEPDLLVRSIDFYFKQFDEITTRYGLEKIKTIGDAYMCASGLPTPNQASAKEVVRAAQEMLEVVQAALGSDDDLVHFEIRIGIHTGPVVAGIVGIKKWQYDIWGDTVNIAARMESASKPGRINLSESTFLEIQDEFPCEYRGEIEVKNRGALRMYFLS
jgi:class 3 adenylate cyclase